MILKEFRNTSWIIIPLLALISTNIIIMDEYFLVSRYCPDE